MNDVDDHDADDDSDDDAFGTCMMTNFLRCFVFFFGLELTVADSDLRRVSQSLVHHLHQHQPGECLSMLGNCLFRFVSLSNHQSILKLTATTV